MVASVRTLVRAALFGTFAAVVPMLLVTIVFGVGTMMRPHAPGDTSILPALYIVVPPLVVMLLTALLKRTERESARVHGLRCDRLCADPDRRPAGDGSPAGYWMRLLGLLGGAVTGRTWWSAARKQR